MLTAQNSTFTEAQRAELYDKVLQRSSLDRQALHLTEEMSELTIAVSHLLRGRTTSTDNLTEEMADVIIMIDEMRYFFKVSEEDLQAAIDAKMQKFSKQVEQLKG